MKRASVVILLLASGILAASVPAAAQASKEASAPTPTQYVFGQATINFLTTSTVDSSKFQEYRDLPNGIGPTDLSLVGARPWVDFAFYGQNIRLSDQRYFGYAAFKAGQVSFDYNEIVHNVAYTGRSMLTEVSPGNWQMSSTLRSSLQSTYDGMASAARTYPVLSNLFAPSLASGSLTDVGSQRNRGTVQFDLGKDLPFGMKLSYMREARSGSKDTTPTYVSSQVIELPTPTNFLTQNFGLQAAVDRKWGNLHGGYNYNWFTERQDLLVLDNPLRATDATYNSKAGIGGPARAMNVMPPSNSASTISVGGMLKFAKQTRIVADASVGALRQNAPFQPYTLNTAVLTGTGAPASLTSSLPAQSLDGRIDTRLVNLALSTRPAAPLFLSLKYRQYDFDNKTPIISAPGYVSWDRSWSSGVQANTPYGYNTHRIDGTVDVDANRAITFEGSVRQVVNEKTFREAAKNTETGGGVAAIVHGSDLVRVRAFFDTARRDVTGIEAGVTDLMFDQAKRDSNTVGVDIELSPVDPLTFIVSYFDRKDTYKNPTYGMQSARYGTITGEVEYAPSARGSVNFFYTYERNRDNEKGYQNPASILNWWTAMADDKTNSVGGSLTVHVVPEKWTFMLLGRYQNVNGFMGLASPDGGAAALARVLIGGVESIPNYDDTRIVTVNPEVAYTFSKSWTFAVGGWYQDYTFNDAMTTGAANFPMTGIFLLAGNDGSYTAKVGYARLNYRF